MCVCAICRHFFHPPVESDHGLQFSQSSRKIYLWNIHLHYVMLAFPVVPEDLIVVVKLSDMTASLVPLSLKVIQICICIWLVFVFQHLIVWRSGWLFGQTCFNWNLKWVCWYRRGAFSQLLHPALRTLQWLRYLDENAKIRPHLNTSKNTLLERHNLMQNFISNLTYDQYNVICD